MLALVSGVRTQCAQEAETPEEIRISQWLEPPILEPASLALALTSCLKSDNLSCLSALTQKVKIVIAVKVVVKTK